MRFFVNSLPVSLHQNPVASVPDGTLLISDTNAAEIFEFYKQIAAGKIGGFHEIVCGVDELMYESSSLLKYFHLIEAAGGLVEDADQGILFIYRNGKWDLPKGKLEKGESPEEAAVREVNEECGVDVRIQNFLCETLHTYYSSHDGKHVLKKTYWYQMEANSSAGMKPQVEEGIDAVLWKKNDAIEGEIFRNTYPSIVEVIRGNAKHKASMGKLSGSHN